MKKMRQTEQNKFIKNNTCVLSIVIIRPVARIANMPHYRLYTPGEIDMLNDSQLYKILQYNNITCGPIVGSTRDFYKTKLKKMIEHLKIVPGLQLAPQPTCNKHTGCCSIQ